MVYRWTMTNYDLRLTARKQLKGVWGKMARVVFVSCLLSIPLLAIAVPAAMAIFPDPAHRYETDPTTSIIFDFALTAVSCLIAGPLAFGFAGFYLKRVRGGQIALGDIFDGFKQRFKDNFLLALLENVFLCLWFLLLVVPGIIKALAYSMSFYIMRDNPGMRPLQAITKSRQMMDGSKGRLFMLCLSFIGWYLLCLVPAIIGTVILLTVSLGGYGGSIVFVVIVFFLFAAATFVGLLYLSPYMSLAIANFYEDLKTSSEKYAGSSESGESRDSADSRYSDESANSGMENPVADAGGGNP